MAVGEGPPPGGAAAEAAALRRQLVADGRSLRDLYCSECERVKCKKNSALLRVLPDQPGHFDAFTELDLNLNCVGKKGLQALLRVIAVARGLERVLLADNCLDNGVVRGLVGALAGHPGVRELDLSRNPISHVAGKLLSDHVGAHTTLTSVLLADTLVNPALVRIIARKAAENRERGGAATRGDGYVPPPPPASPAGATQAERVAAAEAAAAADAALRTQLHAAIKEPPRSRPPTPAEEEPPVAAADAAPATAPPPADDEWYGVRLLYNTSLLDDSDAAQPGADPGGPWHGIRSVFAASEQERSMQQEAREAGCAAPPVAAARASAAGLPAADPHDGVVDDCEFAIPLQPVQSDTLLGDLCLGLPTVELHPLEQLLSCADSAQVAAPIRFLWQAQQASRGQGTATREVATAIFAVKDIKQIHPLELLLTSAPPEVQTAPLDFLLRAAEDDETGGQGPAGGAGPASALELLVTVERHPETDFLFAAATGGARAASPVAPAAAAAPGGPPPRGDAEPGAEWYAMELVWSLAAPCEAGGAQLGALGLVLALIRDDGPALCTPGVE